MKLTIDIPEKIVTAIQNGEDYRYDIHTAIAQGIPYEEKSKYFPPIYVNIPEKTKQELIEELQKPQKLLVLPESEVTFERPQGETNAEIFKQTFGIYATELWSMKEADFLKWLNSDMRGNQE